MAMASVTPARERLRMAVRRKSCGMTEGKLPPLVVLRGAGVQAQRRGVPVSVRVPPDLAKRLDRLVRRIAKDPSVGALGIINKSSVVKLALLKGVEALETQYR
jgi:hypothetical protein